MRYIYPGNDIIISEDLILDWFEEIGTLSEVFLLGAYEQYSWVV